MTLACFHRFLLFGWTLYDVRTLEGHLGLPTPEKTGWFETHRPPSDRGDTVLSLPMLHRLYGEGLHHGELRLWNPYLFCGVPIYNNLLLHPFYPPNLILHALLPPRIAYDLNLLLHFFFSGAAMFWLLRAATPGQWLFGLEVVSLRGGRLRVRQVLARVVGYLVSALPFYLGFLWVLLPPRLAWHDLLARTAVIYKVRSTSAHPASL